MIEVWVSRVLLVAIVVVASFTLWVTLGAVEEQQAERERVLVEEAERLAEERQTAARLLATVDTVLAEMRAEQAAAARSREQFATAALALLEALGVEGDPFVEAGEPPVTPVPRGVEPQRSLRLRPPTPAVPAVSAPAVSTPVPREAPPPSPPAPAPAPAPPAPPEPPAPRAPAPPAEAPRSDPPQPAPQPERRTPSEQPRLGSPEPGRVTEAPQPRPPPRDVLGEPEPSPRKTAAPEPAPEPGPGRGGLGREHAPGQQRGHEPPGQQGKRR